MKATIGADAEGRITGMVFDGDFNTGAYASWGPTVATRVPVHASGPYFTPNYRASARAIHTNGPSRAPFAASACRRPPTCRKRSMTSWPTGSASTGSNSA
jgi:CO/xanthine dehydrogenase Mo-binding subunit